MRLIKTIKVTPTKPFNFDATFHKPDHFPSGDNHWESGIRWQTMYWKGKQVGLKITNSGTANQPEILIDIYYPKPLCDDFINSLINEIKYRFNLELNLTEFYKIFRNDKILGSILKKWKGMRPGHPSSLYEYIIIGILLQNTIIRRSIKMFQSLLEKYGKYKQLAVHYI
jgi:3-methyladenine DNA glycosylase/8-oxoguanine DNA glycosylase